MFNAALQDNVLCIRAPGAEWLSSGPAGGFCSADAAYNITVPDSFTRTDLDAYITERRERAGFTTSGPALLTGVEMAHARGAHLDGIVAWASVGLSNPATLRLSVDGEDVVSMGKETGTVNLVVGTDRALDTRGLASLFGVVVEAKTATLLTGTGYPGTTTDAAIVGCDPTGASAPFAGSATPVGKAARVCVRDAVQASLEAAYPDGDWPDSVADAEYGVQADRTATVVHPSEENP